MDKTTNPGPNNPRMSISTDVGASVGSPTTGTTGYSEEMEVSSIDNMGKSREVPNSTPANWSAGVND